MDESVTVSGSQPVDWGQAWVRSSANRAGQARVSVALCRSLFSVGSAVPPRFNTPWPTWRTLQTHAALRSLQAAQPPRSHKQPFPRSFARVRARETLGVRGKEGGGLYRWWGQDAGCWWRDVNFPGSGCSHPIIRQTDADVRKHIYSLFKNK